MKRLRFRPLRTDLEFVWASAARTHCYVRRPVDLLARRRVIENRAGAEVNADLAAMIAEAFAIRIQLLSGSDHSIEAMTERLGIGKGHLTSIVLSGS